MASQGRRKARSPKFDNLGERGRITGAVIQAAPLNDDGVEDVDAFFKSPGATSTGQTAKPSSKKPVDARRQQRPDKADDLGQLGRKTGVAIKGAPRDSKGYEDIDAFYKSPTEPSHTAKSSKHSRSIVQEAETPSLHPSKRARREASPPRDLQPDSDVDDFDMPLSNDNAAEESFDAPPAASTSRITVDPLSADEEEEEQESTVKPPSKQSKGKERAIDPPETNGRGISADYDPFDQPTFGELDNEYGDDDVEQSLTQDYADQTQVEPTPPLEESQDEEEIEEQLTPSKNRPKASKPAAKGKKAPKEKKAAPSSQGSKKSANSKKRKWEAEEPDGVRRSARESVKPLDYWRCERIVYGRRESGPQPHYGMTNIVRIPKDDAPSLSQRGGSKSGRARSRLGSIKEEEENGEYDGWDDSTDPEGIVWDYVAQDEVKRRIAFTSGMVSTKPASAKPGKSSSNYRFQKIFTDGEFMAGGVLEIPVNEKKPLKPARDNTYMIFCSKGAVRVLIYRTTFTIARGGFFLVPRGNSYEIENIGNIDAQLVFMQAREIRITEEMEDDG